MIFLHIFTYIGNGIYIYIEYMVFIGIYGFYMIYMVYMEYIGNVIIPTDGVIK